MLGFGAWAAGLDGGARCLSTGRMAGGVGQVRRGEGNLFSLHRESLSRRRVSQGERT